TGSILGKGKECKKVDDSQEPLLKEDNLLFLKRLRREQVTFGPFRLGKCGFWINAYAIVFGVYVSIFLPFPGEVPVTAVTMNYAGPVFGIVLILAVLDWVFRGRRYYNGPIQEIAAGERPSQLCRLSLRECAEAARLFKAAPARLRRAGEDPVTLTLSRTCGDEIMSSKLYNHALTIEAGGMVEGEEAEFECSPAEDWLDR
ncbi:hypothetical protein B0A55_10469, partial [Friedmanniomyces simplex]